MSKRPALIGYTIFERPADWPDFYVVRPWCLYERSATAATRRWPYLADNDAGPAAASHVIACLCDTLQDAREPFVQRGLHPIGRQRGDVPCILEVWV